MIKRQSYLNQIIPLIDKNLIKVLTGVRRSGKTVLLQQIQEYLLENGRDNSHIVYINFESKANAHLKNSDALYRHILDAAKNLSDKIYIFLDEIQTVPAWEGGRFLPARRYRLRYLHYRLELETAFRRACHTDCRAVYPDTHLSVYPIGSKRDCRSER